jgi:hypothetical protein
VALNTDVQRIAKEIEPILWDLGELFNYLESFSIFFISGVASEEIAFSCTGSTFCRTVRKYYPFLIMLQTADEDGYSPVVQLFMLWNQRIENKKLLKDKAQIERKLKEIDNTIIHPVGAER